MRNAGVARRDLSPSYGEMKGGKDSDATFSSASAESGTAFIFGDAGLHAGLVSRRTGAAARAIQHAAGLGTFRACRDAGQFAFILLLDTGFQTARSRHCLRRAAEDKDREERGRQHSDHGWDFLSIPQNGMNRR